jgi:hypothetical protein
MAVLNHVRDLDISLTCEAQDCTPNDTAGWKASIPGDRELQISWTMLWDSADPGVQTIRDAYLTDTPIVLWIAGGIAAACLITTCSQDQRLGGALALRVVAKPTLSTEIEPSWLYDLIDGDVGGLVVDDITSEPVQVAA